MWQDLFQDVIISQVAYFPGHKGEVNCCAFSPDCQLVLTCSDGGHIYLWKASNRKLVAKVRGHRGPVKFCTFSKDGCLFASASHDCTVRVWSMSPVQCIHVLTGHVQSVETVSFGHDGRSLASGGWDNIVLLWDIQTGHKLRQFHGHSAAVQSSAFSTDSQWLATGSWDHTVKVWSLSGDDEVTTLTGHRGNVSCLCFSITGMLASGSWDGTVRVWSLQWRECVFVLGGDEHVWVRCVAFCRDGSVLASTAEGDKVKVWDMTDGRCLKCLQGHKDSAYGCVFSPSGALLISGSDQLDLGEEEDSEIKKKTPIRQKTRQTKYYTIFMSTGSSNLPSCLKSAWIGCSFPLTPTV